MKLTLALAQIDTRLGDVPSNLEKHLHLADEARRQGAGLAIFPELSLTGYILQDLVPSVALHPNESDPVFKPLLEASREIDLLFGFVEEDVRHRFYISAAYLSRGAIVHIHRKAYLPTYGLFDEGRFFTLGTSIRAFDTPFGRAGILICEDFWHASSPYLLWLDGADLFLFISASPGRGLDASPILGSARAVEEINQAYASLFTSTVVHTNRVGYEDGIHFWGGATVFDPNGRLLMQGPYHEEALTLCTIDLQDTQRARTRLPLLRDERTHLVQSELRRILGEKG